jgi:hypothetical protein
MDNKAKISLIAAGVGFAVSRYETSKIGPNKPALDPTESQIKMLANLTTVLGLTSAVIFETTKNSPKSRKVAFMGLGGLTIAGFVALMYALKKMT